MLWTTGSCWKQAFISKLQCADFIRYAGITREQPTDLLAIKFYPDLKIIGISRQPDPKGDELLNFIEVLTNLTEVKLDFIHRFIRLLVKNSWSIQELDLVLTSMVHAGLIVLDNNHKPILNDKAVLGVGKRCIENTGN